MLGETVGTVFVTANGQLITHVNNTTGITVIPTVEVLNIHIISSGTAASVITLSNGADINGVGGTVFVKETGTSGTGKTIDYGVYGKLFPRGAFVTVDANLIGASITCKATHA